MAGPAQLWPGPKMRAYLRSILAVEPGVDTDLADRLAERCVKRIARMLVWDSSGAESTINLDAQTTSATQTPLQPDQHSVDTPTAPPADAFDPFSFSVVVLLKRKGRTALLKRLEAIDDPAQLRKIAEAQHLGIDKSLSSVSKLREALVAGAEQRLADRRAAAS